jgi:hypothetical protein
MLSATREADVNKLMLSATSSEMCQTKSPWRRLQIPVWAESHDARTFIPRWNVSQTHRGNHHMKWSMKWHQSRKKAAEGWPRQQMPDLDLQGDVAMRSRGENTGHSLPEIPALMHWEAYQAEKPRNVVINCNGLIKRCHCQPRYNIWTCAN